MASSGWEVKHPSGTTLYPCSTKEKIGYVCPSDADECEVVKYPTNLNTDVANAATEYICLDLGQKVRGKNYQVYIIVNKENTAKNKLVCKEFGTGAHIDLPPANCELNSLGNPKGVLAIDNKCDGESDDW